MAMDMKKHRSAVGAALAAVILFSAACASTGAGKSKISDEKNPRYQFEKGAIALKYGLMDEALRYGDLAVELDPGFFEAWMLLGSVHFNKRELPASVDAYGKAAAIKPDSIEAHKSLAMVLIESNEFGKAEAELKSTLAIGKDADCFFQLGKLLHAQGRDAEALPYAESAVREKGVKPAHYNLKGVILNQLGRYDEAVGSFQGGLVLDPQDLGLIINLGITYFNRNEMAKAREWFEKAMPLIKNVALKAQVQGYLDSIK